MMKNSKAIKWFLLFSLCLLSISWSQTIDKQKAEVTEKSRLDSQKNFNPSEKPIVTPVFNAAPLLNAIEGIDFDTDLALNGGYHTPASPSGAKGPNHFVSMVNSSIEWYKTDGTLELSESLYNFFIPPLGPIPPEAEITDPKVVYDQYENRFVVSTKAVVKDTNLQFSSRIFVAVSDDNDPNGTWYYHEIVIPIGTESWADFPQLAIDDEAIYITAIRRFISPPYESLGSWLWIIDKTPFYSGGNASISEFDPLGILGLSPVDKTLQPTHMFAPEPIDFRTFLVNMYLDEEDETPFSENLLIIDVTNSGGSVNFDYQILPVGNISTELWPMAVPQSGTADSLIILDSRILHAVWRDNTLWATNTVIPPSGSGADALQTTAHWFKINTSNLASLSLDDQGNFGGEDIATGAHTFVSSIAVDAFGNMGIGFGLSHGTLFPGAYYAGRHEDGTIEATEVLRDGLDYYSRLNREYKLNLWGLYSSISLDPTDSTVFCLYNQYAIDHGPEMPPGEVSRWGTAIGCFRLQNIPPEAIDLKIVPDCPKTTEDLIASYTYFDANGDPEDATEIRWYRDGIYQMSFDDMLTIPSSATQKCQYWHFTVRPHDGKDFGNLAISDSVHICNTPPEAFDLEIIPSDPVCSVDDLEATYSFSDIDGDPESGSEIQWYLDGVHLPAFDGWIVIPADSVTCCSQWHFTVKPSDGEDFGSLQTSAPANISMEQMVEAEDMDVTGPDTGNPIPGGWVLKHEGEALETDIEFPNSFTYRVTVSAKGEFGKDRAPWLKAQIGSEFSGTCEINNPHDGPWQDYSFIAEISSGTHHVSLSFLNDFFNSDIDEDRNLWIDKVTITCQFDSLPTVCYAFECEDMKPTYAELDGGYVKFHHYWSKVDYDMFFEKNELTFKIFAKADSVGGWPTLDLLVANGPGASIPITSDVVMEYQTILTGILPGEHNVKLDYNNSSWASGRNIYVDRIEICSEGGFLKPGDDPARNDEPSPALPKDFSLEQNYPNPFNPVTHIDYQLPENSYVEIKISNTLGQEIRTLVSENVNAGYHTVQWNGLDNNGNQVVSGIYFYQLKTDNYFRVRKMVLLR